MVFYFMVFAGCVAAGLVTSLRAARVIDRRIVPALALVVAFALMVATGVLAEAAEDIGDLETKSRVFEFGFGALAFGVGGSGWLLFSGARAVAVSALLSVAFLVLQPFLGAYMGCVIANSCL
jgi:hypothetical protein